MDTCIPRGKSQSIYGWLWLLAKQVLTHQWHSVCLTSSSFLSEVLWKTKTSSYRRITQKSVPLYIFLQWPRHYPSGGSRIRICTHLCYHHFSWHTKKRGRGESSTIDTMDLQHDYPIKAVYTLQQGAHFVKSTKSMSKLKSPHNSSEWFYCLIYDD